MLLRDDLAWMMWLCASGRLDELDRKSPEFEAGTALSVVMAANGYPATPEKGGVIDLGGQYNPWAKVFHAGTAIVGEQLVANGGRVLNVTATGATVTEAQARAYEAVDAIGFPGGFCRRDIGYREVARERKRESGRGSGPDAQKG
jgi:phosphoribosylamine--glycine ligase